MNRNSVQSDTESRLELRVPLPIRNADAFAHDSIPDILAILVDNPEQTFSNRELHRLTGKGMSNVNAAVDSLEALGVIQVDRAGRSNQVGIDTRQLSRPDDPIASIPQSEYRPPVQAVRDRLIDDIGDDAGIVLFGSVARGEADRASDLDIFVVVDDERMAAQRAAHAIEDEMADERFDGDRYEPHIVVETRDSAVSHDRIEQVFTEGITLNEAEVLKAIRQQVAGNGTG
ncbi:nucleotidyltransferase domain-containing protein [Halonotius roseus]|uniref:Nucleotidyltransferase domain-containing protein n=1 Tax=Halonotius roseus TaxID=2511997 RepID=A0A544QN15_9EURY|nr:nucleotidyltransferase domain-containing protein [Halonotius roseus]TQQ80306.1 nucleotidyltransferase domain-containing protein [Halonotius roseus]